MSVGTVAKAPVMAVAKMIAEGTVGRKVARSTFAIIKIIIQILLPCNLRNVDRIIGGKNRMGHFFYLNSLAQELDGCIASGCLGHCDGGCKGSCKGKCDNMSAIGR